MACGTALTKQCYNVVLSQRQGGQTDKRSHRQDKNFYSIQSGAKFRPVVTTLVWHQCWNQLSGVTLTFVSTELTESYPPVPVSSPSLVSISFLFNPFSPIFFHFPILSFSFPPLPLFFSSHPSFCLPSLSLFPSCCLFLLYYNISYQNSKQQVTNSVLNV